MKPYCEINGHYVWNYEWLKSYFLNNMSHKDYYFENDDNTMSYLKVITSSNHFMPFSKHEGERLLLKCAISPPEILESEPTEDDRCRHCMELKHTNICMLPDDLVWHVGEDIDSYNYGQTLSICDDCLDLPKNYTVENIELITIECNHIFKLVISNHSDIKYMISAKNYQVYFYEKILCVNDLLHELSFLNKRYNITCCKLCGMCNELLKNNSCACNFMCKKYYDNLIRNFWFIKQIDIGYGDADVKFYIQCINICTNINIRNFT